MENIFITHTIGPSKLDLLLADAPELTEENKEKVVTIIDIIKMARYLGERPIKPKEFYDLYDAPLHWLHAHAEDMRLAVSTKQYQDTRIQGADF